MVRRRPFAAPATGSAAQMGSFLDHIHQLHRGPVATRRFAVVVEHAAVVASTAVVEVLAMEGLVVAGAVVAAAAVEVAEHAVVVFDSALVASLEADLVSDKADFGTR